MKNYSLLEERKVTLENNEEINLKYYLVNKKKDECIEGNIEACKEGDTVYGVKLIKEGSKNNDVTIEEDEVIGITVSEKEARELIETLAKNTVTPVALSEVVDDWATEHFYA